MRALSISTFSGVSSCTWTVIRHSEATLLYSATFCRVGVNNSAPNGCLSRATKRKARICLSNGDTVEGGRRDAASGKRVADRSPNGNPSRAASRAARVCLATDVILEGPGNDDKSTIREDRSSAFASSIVSVTLPTGCRSRRKSIQG